jgi:hypothetical protein
MLPSVSDVVRELTATTTADQATLFKVARQVCAEELNRVKQGLESEPLEVLVARAERLLGPAYLRTPLPPEPPAPLAAAVSAPSATDDPFSETAATTDLRELMWSAGDAKEPFAEALAPAEAPVPHGGPAAEEAFALDEPEAPPTLSLVPDIEASTASVSPVEEEHGPTEIISPPEPFAAEAPLAGTAEPLPRMVPEVAPVGEDEGPGDATLARLRREAEGLDLASVLPRGETPDDAAPLSPFAPAPAIVDRSEAPSRRDTTLPDFVPPPTRSRGVGLYLVAGLVVVGALGAYVLTRRQAPSPAAPSAESAPSASASAEPTIPVPAPAVAETASAASAQPERPRQTKAKAEGPKPEPARVAESKKAEPKKPSAPPASEPQPVAVASALPVSKGSQIVTPDWKGEPVFVVHVGSYKDRPSAAREAEMLAKKTGKPAHAFELNLGERGTWYRSTVGEFATSDEAAAFKKELAADGSVRVGLVYKVTAAKPN